MATSCSLDLDDRKELSAARFVDRAATSTGSTARRLALSPDLAYEYCGGGSRDGGSDLGGSVARNRMEARRHQASAGWCHVVGVGFEAERKRAIEFMYPGL